MKNFYKDKPIIENKFHKTDEPFDSFNYRGYHGYDFDKSTGKTDKEILEGLNELYDEIKDLPHPVAKAKANKYVLDNTMIDINEHDMFVGVWSVNQLASFVTSSKWFSEVFDKKIPETQIILDDLNISGAVRIGPDFDHSVPDWESIMTLGFPGLRERARKYRSMHQINGTLTPKAEAHFDGIEIILTAVIDIIDRLYNYAKAQNHSRSEMYAKCLKSLRNGAPTNTYEALQMIYIYFVMEESFDRMQVRSLGSGLDKTLYSFYKNDIESGVYTRDEIKEMLAYFFYQWQAMGNYWGQPFYLGGTNYDGSTKYNELSELILDVYDEVGIYNPKIQLKINENTPDTILNKVFDMIRRGDGGCFVFCCEPGYTKAVMSYGASYEEALDANIRGCYEINLRGKEVCSGGIYINAPKALLYAFSNGYDEGTDKQIGLKTGELGTLKTFDDFYKAVLDQWGNLIEISIKSANEFEKYLDYVNPSLMFSSTIEGSLQKGVDAYQCGMKFNDTSILNNGFATLVDAVMAVKELVYDTRSISIEELKKALDANWVGYEEFRIRALKCKHKYGNGDPVADNYSEAMAMFFATKINNRPNIRGGIYKPNMHSAMMFIWHGEKTGATPDGRKAGDEMSKNGSPVMGMDKNGATALINSSLKTHPYLYTQSHCLDLMLHPSAVSGDEGLAVMKSLLMTYAMGGGMAIQINVFNADMLRDAQENPGKYKNLQVRVCGWSVLWNNLSKKEQDAYILRAENIQQ